MMFKDTIFGRFAEEPAAECRLSPTALQALVHVRGGDGEYLWQPGAERGEQDRFFGVPIVEDETLEPGAFQFRDREGRVLASGSVSQRVGS